MQTFAKRHAAWIWIAVLAILFGATVPAFSRAMAPGPVHAAMPDPAMEVCTMTGMKTMPPVDPGARPDSGKTDHMLAHCSYCAVHAAPGILPPPAPSLTVLLAPSAAYPPLFYRSAATPFAWSPACPRGPPAPL